VDQSSCSPHHPEDAPRDGITFLNCDIAEAVETGMTAAGGKNLDVFGLTSLDSAWSKACSMSSTCTSRR
jgi:hypothetical protein